MSTLENEGRIKEEMLKEVININQNCKNTFMKLVKKLYILKTLYFEIQFNSSLEEYEELLKKRDSYVTSICKMLIFLSSQYNQKYNIYILDKKIDPYRITEGLKIIDEYQEYIENIYREIIEKMDNSL